MLSNTLKEYISIKDENFDCIILFQMGTFWEAFFEDAKILSNLSGMVLSARKFKGVGEVAQCGFSTQKSLMSCIKLLLANGYKVCLCEEYVDDNGVQKRKAIRTYTKGTIIENEFLETNENNYILALNKKNEIVELSYADVSTGQFFKTKGSIEEINLEIEKIEPNELLILKKDELFFDEIIKKYSAVILDDSFYSQNIENIIENYCEYTQKDFCIKLNKAAEYNINNYLVMDEITRKNLELTRTKMYSKKRGSLLWFLNNTKTPMGARLLKKYLSEPLLSVEKIKQRQRAIEELVENPSLIDKLENILQNFCDLSRICARISNSTIYPKDLFRITTNSYTLEELNEILINLNSPLLKLNSNLLAQTLNLYNELKNAINENAQDELKNGGIINEGYNANLDYLRYELSNFEKEIKSYEAKERKRLDIEKLFVETSKVIGYYIELPNSKVQKAPKEYFKKQTLSDRTRYSTEILKEIEEKVFNLKYKINELEYQLYCEIREKAKKYIEIIRELAHEIATIDVLTSLAKSAFDYDFTKPNFNKNHHKIKDGYHPSLLKLNNEIIKNDTNFIDNTTIILTGANMSGKSTYLKHNAIISVLAQVGSFIPAKEADLTIVDKLFLRQGASDDIITNNSSFMVEMNDIKFILDNITNSSLILLDEPAKSTSAKEGGAIARAFCEYLLENYKTKAIIATHNLEITKTEKLYPKKALNFVIGYSEDSNTFNRKIKRGIIGSSCAINTAILANLPNELITKAKLYAAV